MTKPLSYFIKGGAFLILNLKSKILNLKSKISNFKVNGDSQNIGHVERLKELILQP